MNLCKLATPCRAGITQLVECKLPKLDVAGSSPVSRSILLINYEKLRTLRAIFSHLNLFSDSSFFCLCSNHANFDREAAKEIIKPHARSAFRRLLSLYQSLSRVATTIESSQNFESPVENQVTLAKLETIVVEQLASADDAIEEWKDIVPEDVEELDRRFSSDKTTRDRQ